jgi:hypothetical protein
MSKLSSEEMRLIRGGNGFCGKGWCNIPAGAWCAEDPTCDPWGGVYCKITSDCKNHCKSDSAGSDCVEKKNKCATVHVYQQSDCSDDPFDLTQEAYVCD